MGSPEQQMAQSALAEMNWWQALWALVIIPFLHGKFREVLFDKFIKKLFGGKEKLTIEDFREFVIRNDKQHEEGRHLVHEAISEFGGARRDIARVEGKVDTLLDLMPRLK